MWEAAPFTLSPLRTVFYWSCFTETEQLVEKLQGKAVLVSHQHNFGSGTEMTQAGSWRRLRSIFPCAFTSSCELTGHAIWVIGFANKAARHGNRQLRETNFFFAIARGDLEVLLEPDEGVGADSDWQIDANTLEHQFEKLATVMEDEEIERSRLYWQLAQIQLPSGKINLGAVKLWIGTEDQFRTKGIACQAVSR